MAFNVRQTNIMEFLVDKFNENSFNIPFKQGFYAGQDLDHLNIIWYKPKLNDKGLFDIEDTYDTETYAFNKKRFLVMSTDVSSGTYVGLPDIHMVSFSANVEVMVYAEDPLSLIASKMALEEIRDGFIGNQYLYQVKEQNEASVDDVDYRVVTTASGIDYGNEIISKGRKFLIMSFRVELTVSKNVDFGNQVKYRIAKYDENGVRGDFVDVVPMMSSWGVSQDMTSEQTLKSLNPVALDKAKEVHNYVKSRGWGITFTFLKSNNPMVRTMYAESGSAPEEPQYYHIEKRELEFNSGQITFLGTFANAGDVPSSANVGDYFYILNTLYRKTASGFSINTDYSSISEDGKYLYPTDLVISKKVVYGEVEPADIVYGEPILFAIGFVVSSK